MKLNQYWTNVTFDKNPWLNLQLILEVPPFDKSCSWSKKSSLWHFDVVGSFLQSFVFFSKSVEMLKGKIRPFPWFCACFHSEISVISPPFLSWGRDWNLKTLPQQTNTVTAGENANLLPDSGLCFSFQWASDSFHLFRWENAMKIWCDLMNNEYMLEYGDKGGSVHHLTAAKIASHLWGRRRREWAKYGDSRKCDKI